MATKTSVSIALIEICFICAVILEVSSTTKIKLTRKQNKDFIQEVLACDHDGRAIDAANSDSGNVLIHDFQNAQVCC